MEYKIYLVKYKIKCLFLRQFIEDLNLEFLFKRKNFFLNRFHKLLIVMDNMIKIIRFLLMITIFIYFF